ncbi:MAG: hypothetical protein E7368_02815 [Clostridiales bacterium]|nr:hypothetical protein [Clostridiales bacterium]
MKKSIFASIALLFLFPACSGNVNPTSPPTNEEITPPKEEPKEDNRYIHLSFDDVTTCFSNLSTHTYPSLFDEPFFAKLQDLHEEDDAVFSLYTYNTTLAQTPDCYAEEFSANADWLKLGFHSNTQGYSLANESYENGKTYWNTFVRETTRVCGSTASIDRIPRLEYFSGSKPALLGMRDATCGALGFLSADDSRNAYYLGETTLSYLYDNDTYIDEENNLRFLATDIRGDWWFNFSTNNQYKKPTKTTVKEELEYRFTLPEYEIPMQSVIIFTHEWLVYNGTALNEKFNVVSDACIFAKEQEIPFAFPQEKVANQ